jgi:Mg-chelatase subunit ChlD
VTSAQREETESRQAKDSSNPAAAPTLFRLSIFFDSSRQRLFDLVLKRKINCADRGSVCEEQSRRQKMEERGGVGLVFVNDAGGSMFLHVARVVPVRLSLPPLLHAPMG